MDCGYRSSPVNYSQTELVSGHWEGEKKFNRFLVAQYCLHRLGNTE